MQKTETKNLAAADTLTIEGGRLLHGEVLVRGAKNSISKLMVAALLSAEPSTLSNVADIEDIEVVSAMIRALGGEVEQSCAGAITIRAEKVKTADPEALHKIARRSRIPILFAGPLLARLHEAFVPELGGCNIGPRPVDFHLAALEKLGAVIEEVPGGFHMKTTGLRGEKIRLDYPSVGATEQVLLAAVLADGKTELSNAAVEPEIMDLVLVLQKMGAHIAVDTDRVITITGVGRLRGFHHTAMTDRLEVASWACAAAITNGDIFVRGAIQRDVATFLNKYREAGGEFEVHDDGIRFYRGAPLRAVALETDVWPGFSTDWQQPFSVLLTQAEGASVVHETVYEDRFGYVGALNMMGARIQLSRECLGSRACRFGQRNFLHSAIITGKTPLRGAVIDVPNLRAGFSYVIAALAAEGRSTIKNAGIIRRGYEKFTERLINLGAKATT